MTQFQIHGVLAKGPGTYVLIVEVVGGSGMFKLVCRPVDIAHKHPVLVFDGEDRLHLPLTSFAREAARRLSARSVNVYLNALLPFFTFLDSGLPSGEQEVWAADVQGVRNAVAEYLEEHLGCNIRRHNGGFQLVSVTGRTRGNVGAFFAALKLFYVVMREVGCYAAENPLVDVTSSVLTGVEDEHCVRDRDDPPRMPDISGVEPPHSHRRLTDSFFKLVGKEWVPQIIDDPNLPVAVLGGGRKLRGWGVREDCVTRLLFETGGRIFEITGLTLGDWTNRGLTREAAAPSKGSHGRRVKFFRFSSDTAMLLRRYFDGQRRKSDANNWWLADYLRARDDNLIDLNDVPLFLSRRGTPLTAKSFRETYWVPACRAAGIDADPHQARHWYVTMAVRTIHETSNTEADIHRRLRELIEYMQWRGGEQTMAAYDHYFDAARHADIQDQLHERLRVALEHGLGRRSSRTNRSSVTPAAPRPVDPDMAFLRVLGGANA